MTQWFDPEPTFKGLLFAKELVSRGFEVEVITGFPNYPGGKLYDGYHLRLIQKEVIEGVSVTRLPLFPSHDKSKLGRVANYLSFALSSFDWNISFVSDFEFDFNQGSIDLYCLYNPSKSPIKSFFTFK